MKLLLGLAALLVAEVYVLVQVASAIGVLPCVLLLVAVSCCGPWLVAKAGLGVGRRARLRLSEGQVPGRELLDGVMLLMAGILITVPGFVTDAIGILLLLPPVRLLARRLVVWRVGRRLTTVSRASSVITATSRDERVALPSGGHDPGPDS